MFRKFENAIAKEAFTMKDVANLVTQVASYADRRSQQGQKSNKIPSRVKTGGVYAK
ncbi:MAG: hypothetical protein V7K94_07215 [Nostoc sp.]|uniref:hypothetical protein n=1 Tax=Nostoc sp. TaxID=1180 RepID=UPI002FFD4D3D